jgi:hypothetical protein
MCCRVGGGGKEFYISVILIPLLPDWNYIPFQFGFVAALHR